jgi:hypothetical protein
MEWLVSDTGIVKEQAPYILTAPKQWKVHKYISTGVVMWSLAAGIMQLV